MVNLVHEGGLLGAELQGKLRNVKTLSLVVVQFSAKLRRLLVMRGIEFQLLALKNISLRDPADMLLL